MLIMKKKIAEEIERVRRLPKSSAAVRRYWFEDRRGNNKYENDRTVVLDGVGKKTAEKLEQAGVVTLDNSATLQLVLAKKEDLDYFRLILKGMVRKKCLIDI